MGLYAMVVISIVQIGFNVYGWYIWVANKGQEDITLTTKVSSKGIVLWLSVILAGTLIWSYFQVDFTAASNLYLDYLVAVMGLVAQYL